MARITTTGKVTGELWRVHEMGKEIICFMLENEPIWFRLEFDTEIMPGRADHMAKMLALASEEGNGIEVMLEYESMVSKGSPLFRDVTYIQVRAELPEARLPREQGKRHLQDCSGL